MFTCAVKSSHSWSSTRPFHSSAVMVPVYMQVRKIILTNVWQTGNPDLSTAQLAYTTYKYTTLVGPLTHLDYIGESCFLITAKKSGTKLLKQGQKPAALQAFVVVEPCCLTNTWVFLLHSLCLFLRLCWTLCIHYTFMLFNFGVKAAGGGTAEYA